MKFLEKAFLPVANKETQTPPWPPEKSKKKQNEKKRKEMGQSCVLRFTTVGKLFLIYNLN